MFEFFIEKMVFVFEQYSLQYVEPWKPNQLNKSSDGRPTVLGTTATSYGMKITSW